MNRNDEMSDESDSDSEDEDKEYKEEVLYNAKASCSRAGVPAIRTILAKIK